MIRSLLEHSPRRWLGVALVLELGVMTGMATLGEVPIPALLAGYAVAGGAYAVQLYLLSKVRWRGSLWFLAAVGLRLPWMLAGLSLSDDAWRYLHDGRAQAAGVNPYRYAPAAAESRAYAGPEHELINHPELPTIYPPAAQLTFRAAILLGGTLLSWKMLLVVADLLIGVTLGFLAPPGPRRGWLMVAYWMHPLPVIEFAGNAHLDAFGILGLMMALVLLRSPTRAGMAWAWSVAVKYLALPLAPFFVRDRVRERGKGFALGAAGMLALLYLPFLDHPPFGSLGTFARDFEFNSLTFTLMTTVVSPAASRVVSAAVLLGVLAWLWVRRADAITATFWWIGGVLLVSPIVHPWYITWLLPLALLRQQVWALVWSGTVVLAYVVLIDYRTMDVWSLPGWVLAAEYLPVFALLAFRPPRSPG